MLYQLMGLGDLIMHKPIFILVTGQDKEEARDSAKSFINEDLIGNGCSFDWCQGIKESERWPKYEEFEEIQDAKTDKVKELIKKMINQDQEEILAWIDRGNKELKKDGTKNLGWTLSSFSIASSRTKGSIFSEEYSGVDPIVDFETLEIFWKNYEDKPVFLCGFDIHY